MNNFIVKNALKNYKNKRERERERERDNWLINFATENLKESPL